MIITLTGKNQITIPAVLAGELHGAGRRYLLVGKKHPLTALLEERGAEDSARKGVLPAQPACPWSTP
jgi:hypothetical protein